MSERIFTHNPIESKTGNAHPLRKMTCEEWEELLVDFLDGALAPADAESFQSHRQTCSPCAEMFSQAGQGREWLNFLRAEPEAPAVLVANILAQTSGGDRRVAVGGEFATAAAAVPAAPALPFWQRSGMAMATQRVAQPRLLMTAAMAFFSTTLTLNMAGVRLSAIRLADLRPTAIGSNLDKQYHMASASVVRHVDNLRIVYEMEARWREMGRDNDLSLPADQQTTPSSASPEVNHKNGGKSEGPSASHPEASLWGERIEAALNSPSRESLAGIDYRTADQAERGIA
jgi:hypothetical protein